MRIPCIGILGSTHLFWPTDVSGRLPQSPWVIEGERKGDGSVEAQGRRALFFCGEPVYGFEAVAPLQDRHQFCYIILAVAGHETYVIKSYQKISEIGSPVEVGATSTTPSFASSMFSSD